MKKNRTRRTRAQLKAAFPVRKARTVLQLGRRVDRQVKDHERRLNELDRIVRALRRALGR